MLLICNLFSYDLWVFINLTKLLVLYKKMIIMKNVCATIDETLSAEAFVVSRCKTTRTTSVTYKSAAPNKFDS